LAIHGLRHDTATKVSDLSVSEQPMCYPIAERRKWGAGLGIRRNNSTNCDAGNFQETFLS